MRKSSLVAAMALMAAVHILVVSCQNDPDIIATDEPEAPDAAECSFESMVPDTFAVPVGEEVLLRFRTTPWNLPENDSIFSVIITDAGFRPFAAATAGAVAMLPDSTWTVSVSFSETIRRGDVIRMGITYADTAFYSPSIVLQPTAAQHFIETMGADTVSFTEGTSPQIILYTNPWNLLVPDSVETCILNTDYSPYPYASVERRTLNSDGTWTLTLRLEYGMQSGDAVIISVQDPSGTLYSQPVVLQQTAAPAPDGLSVSIVPGGEPAYGPGGKAQITLRTSPWNLPMADSLSISLNGLDGSPCTFATTGTPVFQPDSTWTIPLLIDSYTRIGSSISLCISLADTVISSLPVVIGLDPVQPFIENAGPDTLTFERGTTATVRLFTNPRGLLADTTSLRIRCATDSVCAHASVQHVWQDSDSLWNISIAFSPEASQSDAIVLALADSSRVLLSQPIVLNPVQRTALQRLSGQTSAYETGGQAHIRLAATPWDLLQDPSVQLVVTDTLGNANGRFKISGLEQQPDSTWTVSGQLSTGSAYWIRLAAVRGADTLCLSDKVEIRKVTISLTTVKVGGTTLSKDSKTGGYTGIFATVTDFSDMTLSVTASVDSFTIGGSRFKSGAKTDFSAPVTLTAWKYDVGHDFTISVRNTGLPVVYVTTPKAITSKVDWTTGCSIRIVLPDGSTDLEETPLEMRGRGNNTWSFDKKPFALRTESRTSMLGMPGHKRWILLANYKDRTLMRNDATFWLSQQTGLYYSIHGQFVELVLNGKHQGNYYLCEQAKIDRNRINIAEPNPLDPETSGYLVEIDMYYDDDKQALQNRGENTSYFGFRSSAFNIPYQFKQPDREEMTQAALDYFKGVVNSFEAVLRDETRLKNHEYEQYLDVDQAIDFMLVNELAGNHDFYNTYPSAGPHSTYMYYDAAGDRRLTYGPGWDFDYHTYMPSRATGWIGLTAHKEQNQQGGGWGWGWGWGGTVTNEDYYYYFLLKDPQFKQRVIDRWNMQKDRFKELPAYIDSMADYLRDSESANYKVWGAINNPNGNENEDQSLSFQSAIDRMKEGFLQRWEWIDKNIKDPK